MAERPLDPVTFEVLRHKLWQVAEEMGAILIQVSSSPVVTEVRDFATALFGASGDFLAMGTNVIAHVAPMQFAVRAVIEECADNPGIGQGDAFILNDPHRGAMHQSDVIIVTPVHYRGEPIAWVGCHCHQADIGAMLPGGFTTGAREIYQEGLRLPPVRFIEGGVLRKDLWTMIFNHVRVPHVALDLKAQIAANNVGRTRLIDLCDRYGADVFAAAVRELMDHSERRMRQRLRALPDGVFRHIDRQDHDGLDRGLYRVVLTVTKHGDAITFDLTGTSPQAPGFINCCVGGAWAGVFAVLLPWVAPDIPWNAGLLRPVSVVAPAGTICNAALPAPVSKGGVGTMWSIRNACQLALSKLLGCSESYWREAMGIWEGAAPVPVMSGQNQFGEPMSYLLMDGSAGGCGARAVGDGVDSAGNQASPALSIPNVETHEATHPVLFLFRRQMRDSPGAGKYRGGAGLEELFMVYDADLLRLTLTTNGLEVPNAEGLFGGLPGSCNYWAVARESGALEKLRAGDVTRSIDELGARVEELPGGVPSMWISRGDLFYFRCTGGGGYGDPLDRDPELVLADVRNSLISAEQARNAFGVVLEPESERVDEEATRARREAILRERLSRRAASEPVRRLSGARRLSRRGEYLEIAEVGGEKFIRCSRCAAWICQAGQNPKAWAIRAEFPLGKAGRLFPEPERTSCVLREFYCPGCGVQFEAEVSERGAPLLDDVVLDT